MIKRHISFDHGPPVGSHSAGLAGVAGYLFAFFTFFFVFVFLLLDFFSRSFTFRSRCRTFFPFFL